MGTEVIMPALGMAQDTGTVVRWRKATGEIVAKGEPLLEVETDKVTVDVEAPASGVLANVSAAPGDEVPVGRVVALIQEAGEATGDSPAAGGTPVAGMAPSPPAAAPPPQPAPARTAHVTATPVAARIAAKSDLDLHLIEPAGDRIRKDDVLEHLVARHGSAQAEHAARRIPASPKARRLAAERAIDIALLQGSGPDGAVLAADVPAGAARAMPDSPTVAAPPMAEAPGGMERTTAAARGGAPVPTSAADSTAPAAGPLPTVAPGGVGGELMQPSSVGRLMAQRTAASFRDTPHFYLTRELPARALMELRERLLPAIQARAGVHLSFTDLLIRILAQAVAEHPLANASWQDGAIRVQPDVNLGVAAATPHGLLVPVIHRAAGKHLAEIARERAALAARALAGTLTPDDLAGSTVTLSNLGMYEVDMFQAIINPPHSMIVAVGRIAERPVARDGALVAAHTFWVTASFDHRVHDGARAAEFLRTFAGYVEEPLGLL